MYVIFSSEARNDFVFVLPSPFDDIKRRTNVKSPITLTRKNINIRRMHDTSLNVGQTSK